MIKNYFSFAIFLLFLLTQNTFALPTDMTLDEWLRIQQQHDERLKQQDLSQRPQFRQRVVQVSPLQQNNNISPKNQATLQLGIQARVNINQANAEEIHAKLEGISIKKAQAIVAYREQNGAFQSIDAIGQVKGIGDKTIAKNRDRIDLQ
ncbi:MULTISPECIES: ComEA family DNA-binding protein [unclassified Acinetobacter]|uniref:ComEA family DNA-binding protein n=1 Tax=unclassified Acinetobacter TaxID=196816 RepID=UPI0035B7582B